MSKKTRVLITGATGFVGQHLWRALEEEGRSGGADFTIFGTAYPEPPSPGAKGLFFADLRSEQDISNVVRETKPDWVFHLAAFSSVRDSWQMRRETIETNVIGIHNLLEAVRQEAPGARVLFVSSADVYGTGGGSSKPLDEESPIEITSPYAFSKAAGEILCGFYTRAEHLDIVIARPFPHTGPGQSPRFVCSDWARQIVRIERGECPPVVKVGDIEVHRDFSDVRDVVSAYILLMQKGRKGEVYNVCSGKAVALCDILGLLVGGASNKVSVTVEKDPTKLRKNDVPRLVGKNRKILRETGWTPAYPLDRSLSDLLDCWRQQ